MSFVIAFDSSPGVQKWVVNKRSLKFLLITQSIHENKEEAIASARKIAGDDDQIFLEIKGRRKEISSCP